MRFYFHDLAQAEFDSAVQYYDDCRRGLGMEFAKQVHATIARIIKYPDVQEHPSLPGQPVPFWCHLSAQV